MNNHSDMTGSDHIRGQWIRLAISLLWMAFPLGALFASHPSAARIVVVLAGFAAFIVCYGSALAGPWQRDGWERRAVWIAAGAAIAVAMTILDRPDWGVLFIFLAVVAGARLPEPVSYVALALLTAIAAGAMIAGGSDDSGLISVAASSAGIGFLFLLIRRLSLANVELRSAQEQLARQAVDEERLRFARDLHDLLGHSLSVISLKAQLAGRLVDTDPAAAGGHIADVESITRDALADVRAAVSGLARPTLAGEMAGARTALEAAGIESRLDANVELPEHVEEVLAWTVREGTTNVVRHSRASTARIVVSGGADRATVEVVDDGPTATLDSVAGHGLAGLRERAGRVGGSLEAGPLPSGGYRLRVEVPLT